MNMEGDPELTADFDLVIAGGQPQMDSGLKNAVTLSLFGSSAGWCSEAIPSDEVIDGVLPKFYNRTISIGLLLDIEQAAKLGLQWMIDSGIVDNVEIIVESTRASFVGILVKITKPGQNVDFRYSINWEALTNDII